MEAKFEVPSEVAREWARKRWAKPNARQREAKRKVLGRLAKAQADGDLAVAGVMMHTVFEAATLMLGRHRLLDERRSYVLALAQAAALGTSPTRLGAIKEAQRSESSGPGNGPA
jgi:hypothetical protein